MKRLTPTADGRFHATTSRGELSARQVVVATGSYHTPRIPPPTDRISDRVMQLHSHDYRNEEALSDGAVLVIGSGQTGLQLAEELFEAGRRVYISVGSAGRVPRRYRGRDFFGWMADILRHGADHGVTLPTAEQLPDPGRRFSAMPDLSGHGGGHDTNLRRYAADGMTLAGRLTGAHGERLTFADDLALNLERADGFFDERFRRAIDTYIERAAIPARPDDNVAVTHRPQGLTELNLARAGISTIIWATGYGLDYRWIVAPIFDELGYPRNLRGATDVPGLYFLGLLWQHSVASASLLGPEFDAPNLVNRMALDRRGPAPRPPRPARAARASGARQRRRVQSERAPSG